MAKKIQVGDEVALAELIQANLRFVVSIAWQYRYCGLDFEDLIQEGNIGLIEAAKRFDYRTGYKFPTFAVRSIRWAIMNALANQSSTVRFPINAGQEVRKFLKIRRYLEQKLGREPTHQEIANALGVMPEDIEELLGFSRRLVSLDAFLHEEDEKSRSVDFRDENQLFVEDAVEKLDLREKVRVALKALTDRERRVLYLYFGLDGHEPMVLEDIGLFLGGSREQTRRIKEKALAKLRRIRPFAQIALEAEFDVAATGSHTVN